ncbi:MAG TPA: MFS transporter [candidate division Zixibacteria bacterium]|nr:MFS transporter [candidate division Zixibacteria bacterium]
MTAAGSSVLSPPPSPFAVFKRRDFTLMWLGQLVDTIGSSLTSLAASILIYRETGSAASVGLMLIATAAPSLFVGLFAGVIVDRYDRKRIMIAANLIRAVLVFLIPLLVPLNTAWLYILVALTSTVGQFFDPAHESVLPEVAPDEELAAANSLMAISSFGSTAIGFAASGLLASLGDLKWAFYIDALTFLLSAVFIVLIDIKPLVVDAKTNAAVVASNLRSGLQYLFDTPILRSLFLVSIPVLVAVGLINSILLPFATQALEMNEFQFGIQEGVTSIGFVIGSLALAVFAGRLYEGQWLTIGYIGLGILGIAYSQAANIPIAITILFFFGMMNAPSAIARRLVIQRHSPREMRGRVSSAFFVTRDIFFLIGMGAAALADVIDVRILYLLASIVILLSGFLAQLLPGLRQGAAQWRNALSMLRAAPSAPGLGAGRILIPADQDMLAGLMPQLVNLTTKEWDRLLQGAQVVSAEANTAVIRQGETSEEVYFILSGQAIAGLYDDEGRFTSLNMMGPGDFFGEIAALTGSRRTADVIMDEESSLIVVTANSLRGLMDHPAVSQLFLSTMSERLTRVAITDMPRFAGVDQRELQELRTVNN